MSEMNRLAGFQSAHVFFKQFKMRKQSALRPYALPGSRRAWARRTSRWAGRQSRQPSMGSEGLRSYASGTVVTVPEHF